MNKKKIAGVAVGIGALSLLLTGCQTDDYKAQISSQAANIAKLQNEKLVLESQLSELSNTNVANAEDLDNLKKELDKTKSMLEAANKVLDEKDTELLSKEAKLNELESLENGEDVLKDLALGENVAPNRLDSSDVSKLRDGEVEVDSENYRYEEYLSVNGGLRVSTSLDDKKDFGADPVLTFEDEGALSYGVELVDPVPRADISADESLVLPFLNGKLEVVSVGNSSVTLRDATEVVLKEGESASLGDNESLKVVGVFQDGKVLVQIGDSVDTIREGDTEKVGDVEVRVKEVLYSDSQKMATLEYGNDVEVIAEDGDEYKADDRFVWEVETTSDELVKVGLRYNEKANDLDEPVLELGESLKLPEDYLSVNFDLERDYIYKDLRIDLDEATSDDVPSVRFTTSGKELRVGNKKLDRVWFNGTNAYYKEDGDWKESTEAVKYVNGDIEVAISYDNGTLYLNDMEVSTDFVNFGATEDAEATDIVLDSRELGKRDSDVLLSDGTVLLDPESNLNKNEIKLQVPNRVVETRLRFK